MSADRPPPLWLRAEHKPREARAAVVPGVAAELVAAGFEVTVEASAQRAFPIEAYVAAGCGTAAEGAWRDAPAEAIVIGLKELDPALGPFRHAHVHFAHVYKEQHGWRETLGAFAAGGGTLYDLEYLVDEQGRRVAAFGQPAGFVGAALGLLAFAAERADRPDLLPTPLEPWADGAALIGQVRAALAVTPREGRHGGGSPGGEACARGAAAPRVLVIGAAGRSGRGALAACEACDVGLTAWDVAETAAGGPFDEILEHDVLVSCVFVDSPLPPFTTRERLARGSPRLRVIVDVGCDPSGAGNPLPLYDAPTTLDAPRRRLIEPDREAVPPRAALDLVAIDHLPSLLPLESSEAFSRQLLPHLLGLGRLDEGVWARAARVFEARCEAALAGGAP